MKDLVLSQIPRETVLCVLSFGSHHELQVVLQSGTEEQRQKHLGFGQRDVLEQDRTTSIQLGGERGRSSGLATKDFCSSELQMHSRSAEGLKIFMGPLYGLVGSI